MNWKSLLKLLLGCAVYTMVASPLAAGEVRLAHWSRITVELRLDLLEDLGFAMNRAQGTLHAAPGAVLVVRTRNHIVQSFGSAAVPFSGDLVLEWSTGRADFASAQVWTDGSSMALELVASDGTPVFDVDHLHRTQDLAKGQLHLFNGDVRLSEAFAGRIGMKEHAGLAVGVLELTAFVPPSLGSDDPPPCPDPGWELDVDVALTNIDSLGQGAREPGVRVALLPSASLQNVGQAAIPWYRRFSGTFAPFENDQHPYLVWNLYRISQGRLEQIGRSSVKHAFHTINIECEAPYDRCSHPQYNNVFWPTCRDIYGESTNARLRNLGPRTELDPLSGVWESCGSLADRDCDGEEDDILTSDPFAQQMSVAEEDLKTPGARYFVEAWYVARGDVNIFNSMGYREVAPDDRSGAWAFQFLSSFRNGPAVNAWVPPEENVDAVEMEVYSGPEGHFELAVRTRELGRGRYRYDYVGMNLDLTVGINRLMLPLAPAARLLATDFTDADDDPTNDWTVERGARFLRWTAPAGGSLPWGTLFRFGFETDVPPAPSTARLSLAEGATSITLETLAPAPPLDVLVPDEPAVSTPGASP